MPGNRCCVKDCESTSYHRGISHHRFPLEQKLELEQILQKWIDFVNIPSFEPAKHSRICSLHFLDSDYYINHLGKKSLNREAIPSVKVCSDDEFDAEPEPFTGAVTEGGKSYGNAIEPTGAAHFHVLRNENFIADDDLTLVCTVGQSRNQQGFID